MRVVKGNIKAQRINEDLIVNDGLAKVAHLLLTDIGGTACDYLAIGTASTAAGQADTGLAGETHRVAGTGTLHQSGGKLGRKS